MGACTSKKPSSQNGIKQMRVNNNFRAAPRPKAPAVISPNAAAGGPASQLSSLQRATAPSVLRAAATAAAAAGAVVGELPDKLPSFRVPQLPSSSPAAGAAAPNSTRISAENVLATAPSTRISAEKIFGLRAAATVAEAATAVVGELPKKLQAR